MAEGSTIRRAGVDDAPALAAVHVASWRAAYRGMMPDDVLDGLDVAQHAARWRTILGAPEPQPNETWLLLTDAGVVGFASVGPSRDAGAPASEGEVLAIYLAPGAWGRGHGRALLAHAFAAAARRGFSEVVLWVLEANARARRFYEAAGMRFDGGEKVEAVSGAALAHVRYRSAVRAEAT